MGIKERIKKKPRRFVALGILGAIALFIGGIILAESFKMSPNAKAQVKDADAIYHAGKFAEAEAAYQKANDLAPGTPKILKQLGNIALWNNRAEEAVQYYQEALDVTPWYFSFWPLTSELKYRLGLAYYRMDRFTEAASVIREGVGPVAVGPLKDLQALGKQMELFAGQNPYEIEGPEESRVDFVITDPLPVVEVSVNGLPPQNFIVDTGGAEIVLDDDLAAEAGAQIGGSLTGSYAGGKTASTGLGRVDTIRIGEHTVSNVPIHVLDTDHWSSDFGMELKGVVGTRFLMHFLSTIDYPNGTLVLRRINSTNMQRFEEQITATDAAAIPFWLIDLHTMVAWGTINDLEPMLFFVDTGLAGKAFTAPEAILQRAGIPVEWEKAEEAVGGGTETHQSVEIPIRRLTLGSGDNEIVQSDLLGSAIEGGVGTLGDSKGFQIDGLISHQFFRDHALTFDFTNMQLVVR
ncbi:MAG: aspartyl protease family protein [Anaerolineae bacterium]|nr:aspartyl protease family protein [Anaerolineae bacterium]